MKKPKILNQYGYGKNQNERAQSAVSSYNELNLGKNITNELNDD